jgi:uncharacterized SAM-binding protein YcdF (DUF218 family)
MFGKEYTFETKSTRFNRLKTNGIILSLFVLFIFTVFCFYLPIHSKGLTLTSSEKFYQLSPDMIAVFTGGKGRIAKGIGFAKKYPDSKFFISGVYTKNSYQNILNAQDLNDKSKQLVQGQSHQLDIDYKSRNTLENVLSTFYYLRKNNMMKNVLIISSDYHLFRIKMMVNAIRKDEDDFKINYYGTETDYSKSRNIKILLKEVVKVFKSFIFLMFWDH